jgi:beta-glucosidase
MADGDCVKRLALFCILVCIVRTSSAQNATAHAARVRVIDSQETLSRNLRPAGAPASQYAARVQALLARMTLKEKVGQMTQFDLSMIVDGKGPNPPLNSEKLRKAVAEYGAGSIINVWEETITPKKWHEIIRAIQAETAKTRLKIPVIYGIDSIHGPNYVTGATLFPQPLGMAATWNPDLMLRDSQVSAAETRASGIPWNFSPILDVGRQPVWPRLYETFGEDPYLASVMGVASLRGYEGANIADPKHVAACAKHYVGYSFPLSGHDRTPALIPDNVLREDFLPSFAAAVKAGIHSVMVNSGDVNGTPGHVNRYLLRDVLRKELGFTGVVDSDWEDIKKLVSVHHIAATEKDATRMAIMAGIDMSMVPSDYSFSDLLIELVNAGQVPVRRIDEAVGRVLTLKYEMGLFDDPLLGMNSHTAIGSKESRRTSLDAARESIILLKNEQHILPLKKSARVLVTGPTADSLVSLNNGWSYTWQGDRADLYPKDKLTVLAAIKAALPPVNVAYSPGADYDRELNIADAVSAARTADVAIVCLGEMAYAETPGNSDDLAPLTPRSAWLSRLLRLESRLCWCSSKADRGSSAALPMPRKPSSWASIPGTKVGRRLQMSCSVT